MKEQKIKRYRLGISQNFPTTHPRKGEPTYFVEKINNSIGDTESCNVVVHSMNGDVDIWPKLHTIRANYPLWEKRIKDVQAGCAVIELFYWDGKPRHKGSKQIVFATLDKNSGCGVQELKMVDHDNFTYLIINNPNEKPHIHSDCVDFEQKKSCVKLIQYLSENDGVSLEDFKSWFKGYDLSEPMAIIHFTKFRY